MTPDAHGFVGLEAYSRDGERIGRVEDVIRDPDSARADCLVIRYGPLRDLVVPVEAVQTKDGGITLPISHTFLEAGSDARQEEQSSDGRKGAAGSARARRA